MRARNSRRGGGLALLGREEELGLPNCSRTPTRGALTLGEDTVVLSRREREVATLASNGLSNKEISAALFVSPRTVENHLQRVYEKLGIRRRDDLVEALTRTQS